MKLICAESVTNGVDYFSKLGDVEILPDGEIADAEKLRDATALIIRSKTTVDGALLERAPQLQFVGTATAGFDHLDTTALEQKGVAWSAAPGSNATSVAEYITAALLHLHLQHGVELKDRTLGIIGVGEVGRRVDARAKALGMNTLLNDPPRHAVEPDNARLRPRHEVLEQADIITMHVPLTDDGPCPTRNMVDARFLEACRPGTVFINSARGEIVDEETLLLAIQHGAIGNAVLDVWQHEPHCRRELLAVTTLGTPHIAGYSYDGRIRGTQMIYQACCHFFEQTEKMTAPDEGTRQPVTVQTAHRSQAEIVAEAVAAAYNITEDDRALRSCSGSDEERARHFSRLRKTYRKRREFSTHHIALTPHHETAAACLQDLGFHIGKVH